MSDKYEWECVRRERETAEAAIKQLVRSLRRRGIALLPKDIEEAREAAAQLSFERYFG